MLLLLLLSLSLSLCLSLSLTLSLRCCRHPQVSLTPEQADKLLAVKGNAAVIDVGDTREFGLKLDRFEALLVPALLESQDLSFDAEHRAEAVAAQFTRDGKLEPVALGCLRVDNPIRATVIKLVQLAEFDQFILLLIIANALQMAMEDPLRGDGDEETDFDRRMKQAELGFVSPACAAIPAPLHTHHSLQVSDSARVSPPHPERVLHGRDAVEDRSPGPVQREQHLPAVCVERAGRGCRNNSLAAADSTRRDRQQRSVARFPLAATTAHDPPISWTEAACHDHPVINPPDAGAHRDAPHLHVHIRVRCRAAVARDHAAAVPRLHILWVAVSTWGRGPVRSTTG